MIRIALIPCRRLLVLFAFLAGFALPVAAATDAYLVESYGKLPLQFEENQGQTDEAVRFLSRGAGYSVYFTADEAVLVLAKPDPGAKRNGRSLLGSRETKSPAQAQSVALRLRLVGVAPTPNASGRDALPGKVNYFIGSDPAKWRTNVPTYAKVHYREVYPGIDLVYHGNQRQLGYDFVVAPGADPNKIVLDFQGADKLEIDTQGDLVLHTTSGDVRQRKPVIYQKIDGVRREIDGGYAIKDANRIGFELAAYDTSLPLIIDPVLAYASYLGGSGGDSGTGIAADAGGNTYVTGITASTNFPTTPGAVQLNVIGGPHVFVTKLNPAGSALVYSTYLGGSSLDYGRGIAVDTSGNAYVTGYTQSIDFPVTVGVFQPFNLGYYDAFVTKLNSTGSALVYSTYLGGDSSDFGMGIAVDAAGDAYVTGQTGSGSTSFPTTPGAFQPAYAGGPYDAFVTKLNPTGSALVYSTFLGGGASDAGGFALDAGSSIAIDSDDNAYVTGSTDSTNFPTTPGAFQTTYLRNCCEFPPFHAFVTKLNPAGSALVYSTYLGGGSSDGGSGIKVDAGGNAYVTGSTSSIDFPTTIGAFQATFAGDFRDAFVTKLNPAGTALVYSSFLGGSSDDSASGIAVDAIGNAYVTGGTASINFPTTLGAPQPINGGGLDAFVMKLNPIGSALVYSTYIGGTNNDFGASITVDTTGNAYVAGQTGSSNFPTTSGAFQPVSAGGYDAFVAKIVDVVLPPPPVTSPLPASARQTLGDVVLPPVAASALKRMSVK
jgi:hypothetical protein